MATAFQFDVFISHSSKDKPAARELVERLKGGDSHLRKRQCDDTEVFDVKKGW